jgi:hypothetical protein
VKKTKGKRARRRLGKSPLAVVVLKGREALNVVWIVPARESLPWRPNDRLTRSEKDAKRPRRRLSHVSPSRPSRTSSQHPPAQPPQRPSCSSKPLLRPGQRRPTCTVHEAIAVQHQLDEYKTSPGPAAIILLLLYPLRIASAGSLPHNVPLSCLSYADLSFLLAFDPVSHAQQSWPVRTSRPRRAFAPFPHHGSHYVLGEVGRGFSVVCERLSHAYAISHELKGLHRFRSGTDSLMQPFMPCVRPKNVLRRPVSS